MHTSVNQGGTTGLHDSCVCQDFGRCHPNGLGYGAQRPEIFQQAQESSGQPLCQKKHRQHRRLLPTPLTLIYRLIDQLALLPCEVLQPTSRFRVNHALKLHFRGARVFDAIMEDLLAKGLKNASNCFYPQYVAPGIRTPLFLVNSAYDLYQVAGILAPGLTDPGGSWFECQFDIHKCTTSQIKSLLEFKSKFIRAVLSGLPNHLSRGMFINTCHTHCQTEYQDKWFGNPTATLRKKSISDAVGDWFYDRSGFQEIDKKHGLPHWCVIDPIEPNPKNNYTWPH
ncbi:hypothetical protein LguiA_007178 [Lonicera macranthoides]